MGGIDDTAGVNARRLAFLAGFLLVALFVPSLASPSAVPRWCFLAVAAPLAFCFLPNMRVTALHIVGALGLVWCALSLAWAPPFASEYALGQMVIVALLFCVGAELDDPTPIIVGMAWGLAFNGALVVAQSAGWTGLPCWGSKICGLFVNKNYLGHALALVTVALAGYGNRRHAWLAVFLVVALWLTHTKAAELALGIVALVAFARLSFLPRTLRFTIAGLALAACATFLFFDGFGSSSGMERLTLWANTIDGLTWRGHGIGSFADAYQPFQQYKAGGYVEHAHNDFLELVFELGVVGAVLLAAALLAFGSIGWTADTAILFGFAIIACVDTPWHQPVTAALGGLIAGHAARSCRDWRALCDALSRRGSLLFARLCSASGRPSAAAVRSGARAVSARSPLPGCTR